MIVMNPPKGNSAPDESGQFGPRKWASRCIVAAVGVVSHVHWTNNTSTPGSRFPGAL